MPRLIDLLVAPRPNRLPGRGQAVELLESWPSAIAAGPLENLQDYTENAYRSNGIVFALIAARAKLLSEVEFKWQDRRTGNLFGTEALRLLEEPWPGGTTGDLVTRIEVYDSLAGNAYVHRTNDGFLQVLRPDWTQIVSVASRTRLAGFSYKPPGEQARFLSADEVAHIIEQPDPLHPWRGQSWLTPAATQILADSELEQHKRSFLRNAATPNMLVKVDKVLSPDERKAIEAAVARRHEGPANAWKTMVIDAGADVTVVGKDMQEISFVDLSAEGEARICQAASTPPVIVGALKGLDASTYSNFEQAFRLWVDVLIRPRWRQIASKLDKLFTDDERPANAVLTYDDRKVPALQEDAKEAAEIHDLQARTLGALVRAGYTAESAIAAVVNRDLTQLQPTGLVPNTLQDEDDLAAVGVGVDPDDADVNDPDEDV